MSAAKKITIPYWEKRDGYLISVKDNTTAEILSAHGYGMRYREGEFHTTVKELPSLPNVRFKKHKLKVPSLEKRQELEQEYDRLLQMEEVLEEMQNAIDAQTEKISKLLNKTGLKLKPNLPNDTQLYLRGKGVRLHNCVSVVKNYDQEAIGKATKRYPELNRCFDLKQIVVDFSELNEKEKKTLESIAKKQHLIFNSKFDRATFDSIYPNLPATLKKKLLKKELVPNFREIELPDPECIHCGGKLRKDDTCRRCNLSQGLE